MIYLDTSVALAHLLGEDRAPPVTLWDQVLVSSRLLQYELWTRIHARNLASSHGEAVRVLLGRIALLELAGPDKVGSKKCKALASTHKDRNWAG